MILLSKLTILSIFIVVAASAIITLILYFYIRYSVKELEAKKLDTELLEKVINEKKESTIKRKKVINIIKSVIFYGALVIILPFLAYAIISKINNENIPIGDHILMVVGSDSMSFKNEVNEYLFDGEEEKFNYQFKTGDILILKTIKASDELALYDIISYYDSNQGRNIIHRIKEIKGNHYVTRGDTNNRDDDFEPTIKDVVGKYEGKKIDTIGKFILFVQDPIGLATIFAVFYLMFIVDFFLKKYNKKEKEKIKDFEEIIGYDGTNIKYMNNDTEVKFDVIEINYMGYCYRFNEKGFIDKNKILDNDLLDKSKECVIKKITTGDEVTTLEINMK